jgi:hypothetical protein
MGERDFVSTTEKLVVNTDDDPLIRNLSEHEPFE